MMKCPECMRYDLEDYSPAFLWCPNCEMTFLKSEVGRDEKSCFVPIDEMPKLNEGEKFCHICRKKYTGRYLQHKHECS